MPFSVEAKNAMLDYLATLVGKLSIHDNSVSPGATGAGEIAGTTRQTPTWGTASGGSLAQTNTVSFASIPSGTTAKYIGMWNTAGTVWYGYQTVTEVVVTGSVWTYVVNPGAIDLNAIASA